MDAYEMANNQMIDWLRSQTPDVRHAVCMELNWDVALPTMHWILSQPDCDRASAIEMFWRAEPLEFVKYANRDEVSEKLGRFYLEPFDICEAILAQEKSGLYKDKKFACNKEDYNISYCDLYRDAEAQASPDRLPWIVPPDFYTRNEGEAGYPLKKSPQAIALLDALGTMLDARDDA